MREVWSIEKAAVLFSERGCILISDVYVNTDTRLKYIASCGHMHEVSLSNFLAGKGALCRVCRQKAIAKKKVYSYRDVMAAFQRAGCQLLTTEYTSANKQKLRYIAQCGHENQTTFTKFKSGSGRVCAQCSKSIRYEDSYIESFFVRNGCVLLSEYVNCKTPLRFIAKCGHEHELTFDAARVSPLVCPKCNKKKSYSNQDIRDYLEQYDCVLLDITGGQNRRITYVAQCGHERISSFSKFVQGHNRLCTKCSRPKGDKHHAYNPSLTDIERVERRDLFAVIKWREAVYERDGYICAKCGKMTGGDLNAHHLDGYNWCEDKRFDVNNGITLCGECHKDFHGIYGYGNNTREQYEQWTHGNTEVKRSLTAAAHRNA